MVVSPLHRVPRREYPCAGCLLLREFVLHGFLPQAQQQPEPLQVREPSN
jgi:hypothetical protein